MKQEQFERQRALAWWNKELSIRQKEEYFAGYEKYTPAINYQELTGSEIQNIWAVKTTPPPTVEEGKEDESQDDTDPVEQLFELLQACNMHASLHFPFDKIESKFSITRK